MNALEQQYSINLSLKNGDVFNAQKIAFKFALFYFAHCFQLFKASLAQSFDRIVVFPSHEPSQWKHTKEPDNE